MIICKNKIVNTLPLVFTWLIIASIVFILNYTFPNFSDDFETAYQVRKPLDGIKLAFSMYSGVNGRLFGHLNVITALNIPKIFFNFINTIIFCLYVYLIYRCLYYINNIICERFKCVLLSLISFVLFFFMPNEFQVFLWVTGSAQYLWQGLFILAYICCFVGYYYNSNIFKNRFVFVALIFISFLAGFSNENSSPSAILFSLFVFLFVLKSRKEINKKYIVLIAIAIIGFLCLFFAPGSWARMKSISGTNDINISALFTRFASLSIRFYEQFKVHNFVFIFLVAILLSTWKYVKYSINCIKLSFLFFLCMLITNFILILSPVAPERAKLFVHIFYIICIFSILIELISKLKFLSCLLWFPYLYIILSLVPISLQLVNSLYYKSATNELIYNINLKSITGEKKVIVSKIKPSPIDEKHYYIPEWIHFPYFKGNVTDLFTNEHAFRYFGVDNISIID